ncbi:NlpC/P60 family protein [Streptomyces sp. NPDC021080]|uniref:C40 family peptidase n=1 Tax=Streptomyces sp. NPDC021080 TaxID=3365110 RepID=UPI0037A4A503
MAPERTPPSGEEVARRLSSLYDQAELATGNFNGTRASANLSRGPGRRGSGRGGGSSEPAQEDLMRQWFDGARSRYGPSAPAALPADRLPDRGGAGARPKEGARGSKGSSDLPTVYELEQIIRPVAELTAAPMRELTAGPASESAARPALELTAGPGAEAMTGGAPAVPGAGTAVRAALPAGAASAAPSQKSPLHDRKQTARRKIAAAQELMSRHAARQSMPVAQAPTVEYRPAQEPRLPSFAPTAPSAAFPPASQAPAFPPAPQRTAYEQAPQPTAFQTGSMPQVFETGSMPQVFETGSMPRAYQSAPPPTAFQQAPQPTAFETGSMPQVFETGSMPQVFETGSMPRAYEPAPPAAEYKSVLLPLSYEVPAPAPETRSVLLPLSYETATRPSGYQPAPTPPVSEPVPQPLAYESAPQPPAYESAPRAAAYPSAPVPPVSEPAPQAPGPVAYRSAPMPPMSEPAPPAPAYEPRAAAYPSAPMPPANEPAVPPAPPAEDAWRQSLRQTGGQQAWPAAPGAVDTNPGFDIDSLVAAAPPVVGHDSRAAEAVAFARAQVGRPCVWGASGPGSYDPSGLTQAAWKSTGVMLPRAIEDQARIGPAIDLTAIQPGDLVFFHANVSHVGLYAGDGMMVHAPSPGARITEESVEYAGRAAIHSVVRPV